MSFDINMLSNKFSMDNVNEKRCGNCGSRFDNRDDALVWCKTLQMYVVRNSLGCACWTDTEVF